MANSDQRKRNLVICCDGTWNTPTQTDRGRVVPSNVIKMARAVVDVLPSHQPPAYYDRGVGTGSRLDKWTGGALGIGLSENIQQVYRYIADNYQDGDRLFLFGFSRGAYTVRSLAGLIGRCGLTPADDRDAAIEVYKLYREAVDEESKKKAAEFKSRQRQPKIYFLGVWDTVGALGVPALSRYGLLRKVVRRLTRRSKYAHGFHDEKLGSDVIHAYHALAIDERRGPFAPSIWKKEEKETKARPNVEQVWFVGVHSNIGGGYVDAGLSDHAFMWMAAKAKQAGLVLDGRYLAMRLDPNAHGELRDSMSLLYKAIPSHVREVGRPNTLSERIHGSVQKRVDHPTNNYTPANLMQALEAGVSRTGDGLDVIEEIREASSASKWEEGETPRPRRKLSRAKKASKKRSNRLAETGT